MAKIIDGTKRELLSSLDYASHLIENGDVEKALDVLTLANSEHPDNPECMAELALVLAEVGLYDESISIYGQLIGKGTLPDEQSALEAFSIVMPENDEKPAFYELISKIFPDIDEEYFLSAAADDEATDDGYLGEGLIDEMQRSLSKGDYAAVKRYYRNMPKDSEHSLEGLAIAMKAAYLEGDIEDAFKKGMTLFSQYDYPEAADIILRIMFHAGKGVLFSVYLAMFKQKVFENIGKGNGAGSLAQTILKSLYVLKQYDEAVSLFKELFKAGIKYDLGFLTYAYVAAFAAQDPEILDVLDSFIRRTVPRCPFLSYLKEVFSEYKNNSGGASADKYLAVKLIADNALYRFTFFPGFIAAKPVYPPDPADNDPKLRLIKRMNDPYRYEYSPRLFASIIKTLVGQIA